MFRSSFFLVLILTAEIASAQMHTTVNSDRINFGTEFIPRCGVSSNNLIIPFGTTVTLVASQTYDCIEVGGILTNNQNITSVLRVTTLIILPEGELSLNIPCGRIFEIFIRNTSINVTLDPYQWGNGIVNFGKQTRIGCSKTEWTRSVAPFTAGQSSITVERSEGWLIGDDLLIPDTRAIQQDHLGNPIPSQREANVKIISKTGNVIGLSKPLDFAHPTVVDPMGSILTQPFVVNLSRNLIIYSENSLGVRGHTVNLGHQASWNIQYNEFRELGRTRAENLHNTVADPNTGQIIQVGTHQIGKYADHQHHTQGFGSQSIGNSYRGHVGSKWAYVVHGTSDALIERNVASDFTGGCFVTEDGNEVRNRFINNFCAYSAGNGMSPTDAVSAQMGNNCPGCEGSGFWPRGLMNHFIGNISINNKFANFNAFNQSHPNFANQFYPSKPGGMHDTQITDHGLSKILTFDGNELYSATLHNLEQWSTPVYDVRNSKIANAGRYQIFVGASFPQSIRLIDTSVLGQVWTNCIQSSSAYAENLYLIGGSVRGCGKGIASGGASFLVDIEKTIFQNVMNIEFSTGYPEQARINAIFQPLGSNPINNISLSPIVWDGKSPADMQLAWMRRRLQRFYQLLNYNGSSYVLFHEQQYGSNISWHSTAPGEFAPPESNLTMLQSYNKYGLAFNGSAVDPVSAVRLPGITNGWARLGLGLNLQVPRCVVTVPNMTTPAVISNGIIRVGLIVTGNPVNTDERCDVEIDNKFVGTMSHFQGAFLDERSFDSSFVSSGNHTIVVWRRDLKGQRIISSRMEYPYFVGTSIPPVEPPPTPIPWIEGKVFFRDTTAKACPGNNPEDIRCKVIN